MPDTLTTFRRDTDHLTTAELIRRERQPLPSHAIEGFNYRQWAVAVCTAEVAHRAADFARCERLLGYDFDRWAEPTCVEMGQFAHEAHAGAALVWLSHLQTHESDRRAAWDCLPFDMWTKKRRAAWIAKRRVLWAGFLNAVRNYKAAKGEGR
jgi:hypothetical protein